VSACDLLYSTPRSQRRRSAGDGEATPATVGSGRLILTDGMSIGWAWDVLLAN